MAEFCQGHARWEWSDPEWSGILWSGRELTTKVRE